MARHLGFGCERLAQTEVAGDPGTGWTPARLTPQKAATLVCLFDASEVTRPYIDDAVMPLARPAISAHKRLNNLTDASVGSPRSTEPRNLTPSS